MTEPIIPNLIVSISGLPKSGKNYLAYTFDEPIKVYCFNGGAGFVAKRKFPKKSIDIHNFVLPIVESTEQQWALPVWDSFYKEYNADVAGGKFKTLVLDTSTEVENFCRQAVLEELQEAAEANNKTKKKLATNEYLARNLRMNAIYARPRNAGINLVSLQYLKGEWLKEKGSERAEPTGKLCIDGWYGVEAQADINIWIESKIVGGKQVQISTVKSNRFDRDFNIQTLTDTTYEELVAVLGLGE